MDYNIPLQDIPGAPPPTGQTSNFVDPESHGRLTIVVSSVFMSLMIAFVTLRVYSRAWLARSFTKDDYTCIAAMVPTNSSYETFYPLMQGQVCLIIYTAVALNLAADHRIGLHQWDVRAITFTPSMLKKLLILQVGYPPAILFTKLSLFLMYLRIFSPSRQTRYLIFFGITMITLFYTACLLTEVIDCTPRSRETWIGAQDSKRCSQDLTLRYVMAAFNVLSDFYLLAIPIPVVWKLQLALRRKVGISVVFMTGFLGCVCSIINTYYRVRVAQSTDVSWNLIPIVITSVVEICVGIMAGCMPHMASLFRNQLPKTRGSFSFKNLRASLVYPWSRSSKGGSTGKSSQFGRIGSVPRNDMYLETRILGSVQGQGKFLDSGAHPQQQCVD